MNAPTITPYIPRSSKSLTGPDVARQFDADVFERYPQLVAFVRLVVEDEFTDAPEALQGPFRFLTLVQRAAGSLFEHRREPIQVRAIGFDPSRDGILRDGIVTNTMADRKSERRELSPGEQSALLYTPSASRTPAQ